MKSLIFRLFAWSAPLLLVASCQSFDPPPSAELQNDQNGTMTTTPEDPLVLEFSEPFKLESLKLKVVRADYDDNLNLLDERGKPQEFQDSIVMAYEPGSGLSQGAKFELSSDAKTGKPELSITPDAPLLYADPLILLIEPGLEDSDGNKTTVRKRIPFIYRLPGGGPTSLPSGIYYFLINLDFLGQQLNMYADLRVDPDTGDWLGVFVDANRMVELNSRPGCPTCSGDTPVCALLPDVRCAKPSDKSGSNILEYTDRLPDPDPPTGYTFRVGGIARDEPDGSISFGTAPFLIDIQVGQGGVKITAEPTLIQARFVKKDDDPDHWIATGNASVETVSINCTASGGAKGSLIGTSLTTADVEAIESLGRKIPRESDPRPATGKSGCIE